MVKSKLSPRSGSVASRQLNSIHKKGPQSFFFYKILIRKLILKFVRNYRALIFHKKLQILTFLRIFSISELKIRVFDEVYAYLILQFAIVFPT